FDDAPETGPSCSSFSWSMGHDTQPSVGAADPQSIADRSRLDPVAIRPGKTVRFSGRRDVREFEVVFAVRDRRVLRTDRRLTSDPRPVHPAGGLYPVR